MFKYLKYKYLEWKYDRILKKSGLPSWEHYIRRNDPDFYHPGYTVKDQFCGYPHVAIVPFRHLDVEIDGMWGPIYNGLRIETWCKEKCRGKFRWQWERVIMDHEGQYMPNGIAGSDELFFGFKDERDYTLFLLRWS